VLKRWYGKWAKKYKVLDTSDITKLVGIWIFDSRVHVLRRHAGLDMLAVEEEEIEEEEEE
jgi:hypothetical protein